MADLFFWIKQNDTRPEIAVTVKKETGGALDLTGATAKFFMETDDSAATLKVNGSVATIYDGVGGKVKYTWAVGDTDTIGRYLAEFEIILAGGGRVTFPSDSYIRVEVVKELES